MTGWNVVATVADGAFAEARSFLTRFGTVRRSGFYNVLLLRVDDIDWFVDRFASAVVDGGASAHGIAHVFPARETFSFDTPETFESRARDAVLALAPRLAGNAFHVRMHRRGFKGRMSSQDEERLLDTALLEALDAAGTPARIDFDDPDAVIDIETVGDRAGISLWTREDLARYPFLGVD